MAITLQSFQEKHDRYKGVMKYINPIFLDESGWHKDDFTMLDFDKILLHFNLEKYPEDRNERHEKCHVDEQKLYSCGETAQYFYISFVTFFASEDRQIFKSLAQIAEQFNVSRATAYRAMKQLEEADLIERLWTSDKGTCYLIKE